MYIYIRMKTTNRQVISRIMRGSYGLQRNLTHNRTFCGFKGFNGPKVQHSRGNERNAVKEPFGGKITSRLRDPIYDELSQARYPFYSKTVTVS